MKYKAVLKEKEPIHYVNDYDMIKFITENSDMGWDKVCDFVREKGICSNNAEPVL